MRLLYISKASFVAAHRDKLTALSQHVDLTLVVPQRWGSVTQEALTSPDYRIVRLQAPLNGHNHLHFYRGLREVFAEGRFDLVQIDEEPYSLVTGQSLALARRAGVPAVFFAWQNIDKKIPAPFRRLRRWVFERAAGGIAGSEEAAEVLRAWGFAGPLAVIPQMGVDPERFRPEPQMWRETRGRLGIDESSLLVGYAGRLLPEKGVDLLLDAVAMVPESRALVIGSGPEEAALRSRAAKADLQGRVSFASEVRSLEMPRWLAGLDVLVLPSRTTPGWKEQFGRVLIEAMACEVPVVGSTSGEIPNVIGDAGLVFPEGDAHALADSLGLLADPRARERFGRAGRERVMGRFTQERVVSQSLAFYETLLKVRTTLRVARTA